MLSHLGERSSYVIATVLTTTVSKTVVAGGRRNGSLVETQLLSGRDSCLVEDSGLAEVQYTQACAASVVDQCKHRAIVW